ncbi:hypothetical protein ABKA04_004877 [Annulohypoxylon sp. FPYF3050]
MQSPDDPKLIVGIDFGTTYTGVGWAHGEATDGQQVLINVWPSSIGSEAGPSSPKVPTKLRYLNSGEIEWGYQIPDNAQDILSLFKLGLEPEKYKSSIDVVGKSINFENADKNITDYLTGIFKHFLKVVQKQIGNGIFEKMEITFVLTVPAIWGELARQRTLEAFERIPDLPKNHSTTLFSEPEAAATAALRDLHKHGLRVNDSFVVVDAGGGTVDLITYTISSLFPRFEVTEATEGTGDFCGSSRLNDRFIQFLTSRLSSEKGWDEEVLHSAVEYFENTIKRKFEMNALAQNRKFTIPVLGLGANPNIGIYRPGRLSLGSDQIHLFFEPDMIKITELVKDQIVMANVPIKKILLVGGYGSSIYLRERLQIAVREDKSITHDIEILQSPNSWASVVRGAVMKGLSIVNPGDLVSENTPFMRTYYYKWPTQNGPPEPDAMTTKVYSDQVSRVAPLEKDDNVKHLCSVTADLSHIAENEFKQTLGVDGQMYYDLEYQIESIYRSASTEYTLIYKGKRYDTVTAEYV